VDAFLLLGIHLGPRWVVAVYDYRPLNVRDQLAVLVLVVFAWRCK